MLKFVLCVYLLMKNNFNRHKFIKLAIKLNTMKKICLLLLLTLVNFGYGQNIQDALKEAEKRNITTRSEAIQLLNEKGLSENEARKFARIRGIDFDDFLESLTNVSSQDDILSNTSSSTISNLEVKAESFMNYEINESLNVTSTISSQTYFGYSMFDNNPFASKEYLVGNIDEGYIIAPGDELKLTVFGDNQLDLIVKVDLNGNIRIPNLGVFFVSGSTFGKVKERLSIYLGRYFSGLLAEPQRSFLDVSLTQIRPVKITVLGESNAPGSHLVSGFATVLNALYAAGGIKTSGSLREIKVYRNNKLINTLDLYDYISNGNLDRDFRLTNNDIIFIPSRFSTIKLSGEVKIEGLYELKSKETLSDLIRFSGELPAEASINNINVRRITPFSNRDKKEQYDQFLTNIDYGKLVQEKKKFTLIDGDKVGVGRILGKIRNTLTINGNVNQTGSFSVSQYKDLRSLVLNGAKGLKPNTYLSKVDVYREDDLGLKSFKTFNLTSILNNTTTANLIENDSIKVYSLEEIEGKKIVKISGFLNVESLESLESLESKNNILDQDLESGQNSSAIEDPIKSFFWRKGQSIFDLIFQVTSLENSEYQSKLLTSRVDLKRFNKENGLYQISSFSLDAPKKIKESYLLPNDEIILYSREVTEHIKKEIRVGGYVNQPGSYPLTTNMYVEDAILAAGGFEEYADQDIVIINSENYIPGTGLLSSRLDVRIDLAYLKGETEAPKEPYILRDKDIISIRKPQGKGDLKTLEIKGAVNFPRSIVLENELNTFNSILLQVGGLKQDANLNASYIQRNGKYLSYDLSLQNSKEKAIFEDNDIIYIASNSGTVETLGAVENPSLFIWEPNKRAKYYIKNSGGKIPKEAFNAYVILSNKKTKEINFLNNPKIQPNSKIIINRKIKEDSVKGKKLEDFLNIFAVLSSTLTTIILVKNL